MSLNRAIEGCADFGGLEARLAEIIRETKRADPGGPLAPIAIVAPTRRLLERIQVRLAEDAPGLVNVHVFHHDSLARVAARAAGAPALRLVADSVREAILAQTIRTIGGELAVYAESRPGSVAALRGTMDDLREAGVDGAAGAALGGLTRTGLEPQRV